MSQLKGIVLGSIFALVASGAMAQTNNPTNDKRMLPEPSQDSQKPYSKERSTSPTDSAPAAGTGGSGTRALGGPADAGTITNPNNPGADLRALDKQGRGGQQQ